MLKYKKILLFSTLGIFTVLALATGWLYYYQKRTTSLTQTENFSAQMKVSLVKSDNSVKVYLSSNQGDQNPAISAFQFDIKTSLLPDEYELKLNPLLQNQNWTFPLVKKEDGQLKVSGFRMSSTAYDIPDTGILFFTLTPSEGMTITPEIVTQNTIFYDNNAQPTITYTIVNY